MCSIEERNRQGSPYFVSRRTCWSKEESSTLFSKEACKEAQTVRQGSVQGCTGSKARKRARKHRSKQGSNWRVATRPHKRQGISRMIPRPLFFMFRMNGMPRAHGCAGAASPSFAQHINVRREAFQVSTELAYFQNHK